MQEACNDKWPHHDREKWSNIYNHGYYIVDKNQCNSYCHDPIFDRGGLSFLFPFCLEPSEIEEEAKAHKVESSYKARRKCWVPRKRNAHMTTL